MKIFKMIIFGILYRLAYTIIAIVYWAITMVLPIEQKKKIRVKFLKQLDNLKGEAGK